MMIITLLGVVFLLAGCDSGNTNVTVENIPQPLQNSCNVECTYNTVTGEVVGSKSCADAVTETIPVLLDECDSILEV